MSTAKTRAGESVEATEATEATEVTEVAELAEATESSQPAESSETADSGETTESNQTTESSEATDLDPKSWVAAVTGRGSRALRVGAAALLIALVTISGVEGWFVYQRHLREVAAHDAMRAAQDFTLKLANIDPNAIDQTFNDVLSGSTGKFNELYTQSSEQLRQALIDNAAAAHGTVLDAAVKSATTNKVEVMLFVDQSVRNNKLPQAQIDRSRIVLTMEKVDGRWLVSDIDHP